MKKSKMTIFNKTRRDDMKLQNWRLKNEERNLDEQASVPGDITWDLYRAGVVEDPYFGFNHKSISWIAKEDFDYETTFSLKEAKEDEDVLLTFEGIDTFSEIYLNGELLGKTDNMFLGYSYTITDLVKKGENKLVVRMRSTVREMERVNVDGYFGVFNSKRLFIRKAQCHFGWDWAPDMPGYGIYGDVTISFVHRYRIAETRYETTNDGTVKLFANLNYTARPRVDNYGKIVSNVADVCKNDEIRYTLCKTPNMSVDECDAVVYAHKVRGAKNFVNLRVPDPKLWWPSGYGEQPLYEYKIELIRDGVALDERRGRLAFRSVELLQEPIDEEKTGYKLRINGRDIFVKGSNWTPVECFTGTAKEEKYRRLIADAKAGGLNMLRVWGGGIYEKDCFYDLCDEAGLMVWQDFMFACADIPEENEAFVENVKKELAYQIKRLRNHPSVVYWCGGNEKTGSYGLQISHGDYLTDIVMRGFAQHYDGTRPYARQSPCSSSDVGNDLNSGESHSSAGETCLVEGGDKYREIVARTIVPFSSECALMGPSSKECVRKMFPEDKLWPMNEYWEDRLMDNPYSGVRMSFADRQKKYAKDLYGESETIDAFLCKAQTAHAEFLRAEIEYARSNKGQTWGIMNWMFSDIWPTGNWSIVDYYGEPKQAYYQIRRSYAPFLATFVYSHEGKTQLVFVSDEAEEKEISFAYGVKNFKGEILARRTGKAKLGADGVYREDADDLRCCKNEYLFVEGEENGRAFSNVYSPRMWSGDEFTGDYSATTAVKGDDLVVTLKAKSFVKGLELRFPDNYKRRYSDNRFDLQAGEEKTVVIYGAKSLANELIITDFSKETR